jgi:CheY-like chemotaxis protein
VNFELKPPVVAVYVEVDEAGLEAVLLNLTVNARDAMSDGGDLILSLDVSAGMASLVIKDSGTGMSEAVLKRATEPFFSTKGQGKGTGLGLSMVAGFVKQSGGTMNIQSEESLGTTIEISLPLAHAASVPMVGVTPVRLVVTNTKRKILVVDDEPALAELVRVWAKELGHAAVLAGSADDALTLLAVKSFDVLLTDIMMPGEMDGIALAERASVMLPGMKILLMSGYSKATATKRAEIPWDLLVKPFRKAEFEAALALAFEESGRQVG